MSSAIARDVADQAKADQLAPSHFDGTNHRAAFSTAPLRGMRWARLLGQAVADWTTCWASR